MPPHSTENPDVLLVGAGIVSATLAVMFKELNPTLTIEGCDMLGDPPQESSSAWNKAGTAYLVKQGAIRDKRQGVEAGLCRVHTGC